MAGRGGGRERRTSGPLYKGYSLVVNYTYDGRYRLVGAAYSDGATYGYAYDAVGNRLAYTNTLAPVTLTTYTHDAADRLTAVTRAGVVTPYTWSDRGELLADGTQSYAWDAAGLFPPRPWAQAIRLSVLAFVAGPIVDHVGICYNGFSVADDARCPMAEKTTLMEDALAVSEQLSPADQLRLIDLLSERLRHRVAERGEPVDMLALAGVGAEVWRSIDTAAYLEQERDSWER